MELSTRLQLIATMVDECESIVDVGTDHGYIPIYLIKNGICNRAVASDINKGPVDKASKNIQREGLQDRIQCRLGSGLSTVAEKEVDGAIIAGMGGNLIRDIVLEDCDVFKNLKFAILQPVQNAEVLRKFIYENGFVIIDEELCYDENKFYEIIKVKYGNSPRELDEIHYEISPVLLGKRHPLIKEFVEYKRQRYEKILEAIKEETELAEEKKKIVRAKVLSIEELLKCL